jgi:hypothetical protein
MSVSDPPPPGDAAALVGEFVLLTAMGDAPADPPELTIAAMTCLFL